MQVILKWVAQFLLLPLIKDGIKALMDYMKTRKDLKRIKEENAKKGEAYEEASPETAHDEFSKLP